MGIYAQTHAKINCKTIEKAKKVLSILKKMAKKSDENGNFMMEDMAREKSDVVFFLSSGRIQNLEWQCEEIWKNIEK